MPPKDITPAPTEKWCNACQSIKPRSEFGKHRTTPDSLYAFCRVCARAKAKKFRSEHPERHHIVGVQYRKKFPDRIRGRKYQVRYGLTLAGVNDLAQKQDGACALCKRSDRKLQVDHDHATGKVRGLLCQDCNQALGFFRDNVEALRQAVSYLTHQNPIEP